MKVAAAPRPSRGYSVEVAIRPLVISMSHPAAVPRSVGDGRFRRGRAYARSLLVAQPADASPARAPGSTWPMVAGRTGVSL